MKKNYNILMKEEIKSLEGRKKTLLLHSCCGPCSTYVINRLKEDFDITIYYYNPNIFPKEEYLRRENEQMEYLDKVGIPYILGKYAIKTFYSRVAGLEKEKEGAGRCLECYKLRLEKTAKKAIDEGFDYFTTTLSVSPHKNSQTINEIGLGIQNASKDKVKFLVSDFKKEDGFKESIRLSKKEKMYRQEYCGCIFSLKESEDEK